MNFEQNEGNEQLKSDEPDKGDKLELNAQVSEPLNGVNSPSRNEEPHEANKTENQTLDSPEKTQPENEEYLNAYDEEKINKIIKERYPDNVLNWLQKNDYDLFITIKSILIPKCKDQLIIQEKINAKERHFNTLKSQLQSAEKDVAEKMSALRFWERNDAIAFPALQLKMVNKPPFALAKTSTLLIKPWSFLNILLDWVLKIGLSVVPILSLFSILTIKNLNNLQDTLSVRISIFCGISLVWLTSATFCNWVITGENKSKESSPVNTQWQILDLRTDQLIMLFFIWLLEALIGFATIPPLIDQARTNPELPINPITNLPDPTALVDALPPLSGWEKIFILFGVSIFASINLLYAITKGRIYNFNTTKKAELGKAIAERDMQRIFIEYCQQEIEKLKTQNQELEQLLKPDEIIKTFHRRINDLSNLALQGKDIKGIDDDTLPGVDEDTLPAINNNQPTH